MMYEGSVTIPHTIIAVNNMQNIPINQKHTMSSHLKPNSNLTVSNLSPTHKTTAFSCRTVLLHFNVI